MITGRVTVGVVDAFEVVQIQHNAGNCMVGAPGPPELGGGGGGERQPRLTSGEAIARCDLAKLERVDRDTRQVLKS